MISVASATQTCPVCENQYQDKGIRIPLIQSCGHTYCKDCIQKIAKQARDHGSAQFPCPECRTLLDVNFVEQKNLACLHQHIQDPVLTEENKCDPLDALRQVSQNVHMQSQSQALSPPSSPRFRSSSMEADQHGEHQMVANANGLRPRQARAQVGHGGMGGRQSVSVSTTQDMLKVASKAGRDFLNHQSKMTRARPAEADLTVCGISNQNKDYFCASCQVIHCQACASRCGPANFLNQDDQLFLSFGNRASLNQMQKDCAKFRQLDLGAMLAQDQAHSESAAQFVNSDFEEVSQQLDKFAGIKDSILQSIDHERQSKEQKKRAKYDQLREYVAHKEHIPTEALRAASTTAGQNCREAAQATLQIQEVVNGLSTQPIDSIAYLARQRTGRSSLRGLSSITTNYAKGQLIDIEAKSRQFADEHFYAARTYRKEAVPCAQGYTLTYNAAKPNKLLAVPGRPTDALSETGYPAFLERPCILFDLERNTSKFFQIEDPQGIYSPCAPKFKHRRISFVHKMLLILEAYDMEGQDLHLLYKVSGDQVISGQELTWITPGLQNFTMEASNEYLAIVGGDDGVQASGQIRLAHLMDLEVPMLRTRQGSAELSLAVPRTKPAVAFDKDSKPWMIVVGGWADPHTNTFLYSAEIIDVKEGKPLCFLDFNKQFSQALDPCFSRFDVYFQSEVQEGDGSPVCIVHTLSRAMNLSQPHNASSPATVEVLLSDLAGKSTKAVLKQQMGRKAWLPRIIGSPMFQANQLKFVALDTDKVVKEAYCRINFKIGLRISVVRDNNPFDQLATLREEPETEEEIVRANAQHFNAVNGI